MIDKSSKLSDDLVVQKQAWSSLVLTAWCEWASCCTGSFCALLEGQMQVCARLQPLTPDVALRACLGLAVVSFHSECIRRPYSPEQGKVSCGGPVFLQEAQFGVAVGLGPSVGESLLKYLSERCQTKIRASHRSVHNLPDAPARLKLRI